MLTFTLKILALLVLLTIDIISGLVKFFLWVLSGQDIFVETAYKGSKHDEIFFVNTGAYIMKYFN